MHNPSPRSWISVTISTAALAAAISCGPPPEPTAPQPAPRPSALAPAALSASAPLAGWQRGMDPLAQAFDGEQKNPYVRRALARLWVGVARVESGEGSERLRVAEEALDGARKVAESDLQPCAGKARVAVQWARQNKNSLERRYLVCVETFGEDNIETRVIDAQVQALRDDIDELERALKSCPDRWFAPE